MMEGYCIMNPEAKAYKKTACMMPSRADVFAHAYMAEHIFHLPIFYLVYSGTLGDATLVRDVQNELDETLLFYGGGISNREEAEKIGRASCREREEKTEVAGAGEGRRKGHEDALR